MERSGSEQRQLDWLVGGGATPPLREQRSDQVRLANKREVKTGDDVEYVGQPTYDGRLKPPCRSLPISLLEDGLPYIARHS